MVMELLNAVWPVCAFAGGLMLAIWWLALRINNLGIVDIAYYGLGYKDGLSYNIATVIGIGLATLFRLFAYRTFVFNNHQAAGDEAGELAPVSVK